MTYEGRGYRCLIISATPVKPKAVVEIERLGFGYEEVAQYDLTEITGDMTHIGEDLRVQVREAEPLRAEGERGAGTQFR